MEALSLDESSLWPPGVGATSIVTVQMRELNFEESSIPSDVQEQEAAKSGDAQTRAHTLRESRRWRLQPGRWTGRSPHAGTVGEGPAIRTPLGLTAASQLLGLLMES